jgi:ABC-type antimicrobial peptide transport system permease subunit
VFWPEYPKDPDPIGQHILFGVDPKPVEVVGIVADVRQSARENPRPEIYLPSLQTPAESTLIVRTNGDRVSFADAVRNQVLLIDRDQPVSEIATMDALVDRSEGQLRLMMRLLGAFAASATLLAALGLYGVIAYSVLRRTREIGIRKALGARPYHVISQVVRHGLSLLAVGVALGVVGAFATTRLLSAMLFHVRATDPLAFTAIPLLLVCVAIAASYLPARRAAAIDPLAAIRMD